MNHTNDDYSDCEYPGEPDCAPTPLEEAVYEADLAVADLFDYTSLPPSHLLPKLRTAKAALEAAIGEMDLAGDPDLYEDTRPTLQGKLDLINVLLGIRPPEDPPAYDAGEIGSWK